MGYVLLAWWRTELSLEIPSMQRFFFPPSHMIAKWQSNKKLLTRATTTHAVQHWATVYDFSRRSSLQNHQKRTKNQAILFAQLCRNEVACPSALHIYIQTASQLKTALTRRACTSSSTFYLFATCYECNVDQNKQARIWAFPEVCWRHWKLQTQSG